MFDVFIQKMVKKGVSDLAIKIFEYNLQKLINNDSPFISSKDISPIESTNLMLKESELSIDRIKDLSSKVVLIKLNGGLGTSMGLKGAKSQLMVKDGLNFIDITVKQIQKFNQKYQTNVPLIFMNSFNTQEETEKNLEKLSFKNISLPRSFNENKSPKIRITKDRDTTEYSPASYPENPDLEWAPPGHADVYPALLSSGLLNDLLNQGYEYLFISNVDNLGATLTPDILNSAFSSDSSFLMEVAARTENDKKGGHLALKGNTLILRESSQVSKEDEIDFQDYNKYKFFNTNSVWIKISALKQLMEKSKGILDLPIIKNEKNINPLDPTSEKIIQLESAMGSAISLFEDAKTILVPSDRFIPVKNTSNLLYLLSDLVQMDENFLLHPQKNIKIDLKNSNYKMIDDFYQRFKVIPSLINCNSLVIENDIFFEEALILKGDIKL